MTVDPATAALTVDGHPVAVVYYRAGYTPNDVPSDSTPEEEALTAMERSLAVKCPTVAHHLAGTKKVQQVLANASVLQKYLSPAAAEQLMTLFAGIWPLEEDDDATKSIIAKAIANPDAYVLKPQREGGGNNHWGDELVKTLKEATVDERAAYILMARIRAEPSLQALMKMGKVHNGPCLSELGIYGVILSDGSEKSGVDAAAVVKNGQTESEADDTATPNGAVPIINYFAGHLLRTKLEGMNEGGVAAGFSCLNSPYLTD